MYVFVISTLRVYCVDFLIIISVVPGCEAVCSNFVWQILQAEMYLYCETVTIKSIMIH